MGKKEDILQFAKAQGDTVDNLRAIILNLSRCVEEGKIDSEATYYNQLLDLENEASISESWDELMEVIDQAKILEIDVDVWLSGHGQTSISLPWPKRPS